MKPAVLIGGGMVVIAIVAAIVVIGGGPASDDTPVTASPAPAAATTAAQTAAAPPAPAPTTAGNADAAFEAWVAPLRAAGLSVSATGVVRQGETLIAAGLVIADPSPTPRWRWSVASAVLGGTGTASTTIEPRSGQTLTFVNDGGVTTTLAMTSDSLSIAIDRNASGRATSISLDATGLAIGPENAAEPLRIGSVAFRITPAVGAGVVPTGSTGTIRLADIVTPTATASPLGTEIDLFAATFDLRSAIAGFALAEIITALQAPDGVALTDIELNWGILAATGTGTLRLDEQGRLAGALALAVTDPLTVLDAIHAMRGLDRAVMPDVYAAILMELGDRPEAIPEFAIDLTGGEVILRRAARSTGDLMLGTLTPLL